MICRELLEEPIEVKVITSDETDVISYVKPFDLETGPCVRAYIFDRTDSVELLIDVHNIVFDSVSEEIFVRELDAVFNGGVLVSEEYNAYDFAADEKVRENSPEFEEGRKYYENLLNGLEEASIPMPDADSQKDEAKSVKYTLMYITPDEADSFAHNNRIKTVSLFCAAFGYVLSKYAGEEYGVFASVFDGRSEKNKNSVGMFEKTIPVLVSGNEENIIDCIRKTDSQITESCRNGLFSFVDICTLIDIEPQVFFTYLGDISSRRNVSVCGQDTNCILHSTGALKSDLGLVLYCQDGRLILECEYNGGKYSRAFIGGFLETADKTVGEFILRERLCEVDMLSGHQLELLNLFNKTDVPYDNTKSVVDLFRTQAAKTPDHTAVVYENNSLTYRELDDVSERIAQNIHGRGIGRGDVAAIMIKRGMYMPVAAMGVLKSGAAYEPLDPSYPPERLKFMIKDAGVKLLIADEELLGALDGFEGEILLTKDIPELPNLKTELESPHPEDLFIMLYTSGSTGTPKGVMLEHGNLAAFIHWYRRYYSIDETSRITAYASFGFDANMMEMYPALTCGSRLIIIPEEMRLNLLGLNEYFKRTGVTHTFMTTQVGRQMAEIMDCDTVKFISMGGEKLAPFTPNEGFKTVNIYGPTECTVLVTAFCMDKRYGDIPIGKAIDNVKLYIVDRYGHRVSPGMRVSY